MCKETNWFHASISKLYIFTTCLWKPLIFQTSCTRFIVWNIKGQHHIGRKYKENRKICCTQRIKFDIRLCRFSSVFVLTFLVLFNYKFILYIIIKLFLMGLLLKFSDTKFCTLVFLAWNILNSQTTFGEKPQLKIFKIHFWSDTAFKGYFDKKTWRPKNGGSLEITIQSLQGRKYK